MTGPEKDTEKDTEKDAEKGTETDAEKGTETDAADDMGDDTGDDAGNDAPGWDAIDAALAARYGDQQPRHDGSGVPAPHLQACSAYAADGHWHYVTYGLSELFEPIPGADPEVSGWGFELTMRVPRVDEEPPRWPFRMLDEIAQYVNDSRSLLAPGHRLDFRQPVTGHPGIEDAPATGLTVFAFAVDPELGEIDTPNGRVVFLQAVGVTAEEKGWMLASSTAGVLADRGDPLLLTDPSRA